MIAKANSIGGLCRRWSPCALAISLLFSGCTGEEAGFDEFDDESADWKSLPRKCALGSTLEDPVRPDDTTRLPVQGFDVSRHQKTIDWDQVATAGKTFALARVSDGLRYPDRKFVENYRGIASAGLVRGAYQFVRPDQDARAQAELFLEALRNAGGLTEDGIPDGDLPPVLDIEVKTPSGLDGSQNPDDYLSFQQVRDRVQIWLDIVGPATKTKPIVYTMAYMDETLEDHYGEHRLWVANFNQVCPKMPSGWGDWEFFQYSDRGRIPGILDGVGDVDLDVFNGTEEQFFRLVDLRGHRSDSE